MKALILGGGPDRERAVSLESAQAVAEALRAAGVVSELRTIDAISQEELAALPGDVIFPALHGPWGEGGPLQDLLLGDGRPFVGAGPRAARLAMDKVATKAIARSLGIPTPDFAILNANDPGMPLAPPVVIKPVHEGSTIGLHLCADESQWVDARTVAADANRSHIVERAVAGRECTVGLLDGEPLPLIEIIPADGLYDYEAKYNRSDTHYVANPDLPADAARAMTDNAVRLADALGVRHLGRVDYILDAEGRPWLLEINTMPGFTSHSLVPMAARARATEPLEMPSLCARLIDLARRDADRCENDRPGTDRPRTDRPRTESRDAAAPDRARTGARS